MATSLRLKQAISCNEAMIQLINECWTCETTGDSFTTLHLLNTYSRSANYSLIAASMKAALIEYTSILSQYLELEYFYPALNAPHS